MSDHDECGEDSSAGAAAAPAQTAGDGQESEQHALEKELRELEAKIKELETKIASDETKADNTTNEGLELERRRAIAANTQRLTLLEARKNTLKQEIKELSATVKGPTAAGGRSPTSCLPLRPRIGLSRRVLRALLLLREFGSPFHLCARTATRPTRHFARVVRSPSVRVHHPSLCIDGVALSLPHRVCASSHLVHASRGAADCGTWTLSYLVPTLALAHRLACLAGYCARSSCYENLTAPSTCAHNPCTDIWPRNHAPLFGGLALSSYPACSPVPKSTVPSCASPAHLHPCTPLLFWRTSTRSRTIHRHLCPCVALPLCIASPCRPHSPQVVPCWQYSRAGES